jgi:formylglycine-generating enzyme required for sulfatase activity/polyhydroxyalkanoate synthesis regulator phasin
LNERSKKVNRYAPVSFKYQLRHIGTFLIGLVLVLAGEFVAAQDCPSKKYKRSSQTPIVKDMVNPIPSEYDFELPMPCGGRLVLRHVCIPVESFLDDVQLNLGCENCRRKDQGFMEAKRIAQISGAFTPEDLPDSWRVKLIEAAKRGDGRCPVPDPENPNALYFFIGKYEISNWQWQTVMNNDCPGWDEPFKADDPRPKTNVSWFDAVDFTRRYSQWLLKNKLDLLPKFSDGRYAFIRLPTEAEWEYAARGGHKLTDSEMDSEEFFPLRKRPLSDYAVYTQAGAAKPPEKLAWIGIKCPNPLGLFDTAGNAAEMLFDPFRFSIGSRLHGATGGFVIKGGSYRKGRAEIMPGRREEMPFFLENKAFASNDLGFRVVLSAIVTPQNRSNMLKQNWAEISKQTRLSKHSPISSKGGIDSNQSKDFVGELERLAVSATTGAEQQKFRSIANFIKRFDLIYTEKEIKAIDALIWQALFAEESIAKYASRCTQLQQELEMSENLKTQTIPETEVESLNKNISRLTEQVIDCDAAIDYLVQSYINTIKDSQQFQSGAIDRQLNRIITLPNLEGDLQSSVDAKLKVFRDHMLLYSASPESIQHRIIVKDILTAIAN